MATYVLIGGAWMGAWVWQAVARRLNTLGKHEIYRLSLTGLGERVHLGGPQVDLDTHIADVVNLVDYEDLANVILVGHSYAGSVITGVADRAAERIATLIYCDSGPFTDGQRMLDLSSPDGQAQLQRQVDQDGDGWRFPFPSFEQLGQGASLDGLGEAELALMRSKAAPQPFGTYTQPLRLSRSGPPSHRRVIVLCEDGRRVLAMAQASLAKGEPYFSAFAGDDWVYYELNTGHWPMLSTPHELAAILHAEAEYVPAANASTLAAGVSEC